MSIAVTYFDTSRRNFYAYSVLSTLGLTSLLFLLPLFASANEAFGELGGFVESTIAFISNSLVPLIFALALILFVWGVFIYLVYGGAEEKSRETGKALMLWSVFAFVMMVIIWGVVNLFASGISSGLGSEAPVDNLKNVPGVNLPN